MALKPPRTAPMAVSNCPHPNRLHRSAASPHTLANPSLATVLLTTSIAPVYTPFSAVCNRTFTRSNGCPTTTAHTPPTAPPASDRRPESVDFFAAITSSLSSEVEDGMCGRESLSSSVEVGMAREEEDEPVGVGVEEEDIFVRVG